MSSLFLPLLHFIISARHYVRKSAPRKELCVMFTGEAEASRIRRNEPKKERSERQPLLRNQSHSLLRSFPSCDCLSSAPSSLFTLSAPISDPSYSLLVLPALLVSLLGAEDDRLKQTALRLLLSMSSFGLAQARALIHAFNWSFVPFLQLPSRFASARHGRQEQAARQIRMQETRMLFIALMLSLFRQASADPALTAVLLASANSNKLMQALFRGLYHHQSPYASLSSIILPFLSCLPCCMLLLRLFCPRLIIIGLSFLSISSLSLSCSSFLFLVFPHLS